DLTRTGEHHIDLLGLIVAVSELLALAGAKMLVAEPGIDGVQGLTRKARLPGVAEAVLGGHGLHLAEVCYSVAPLLIPPDLARCALLQSIASLAHRAPEVAGKLKLP